MGVVTYRMTCNFRPPQLVRQYFLKLCGPNIQSNRAGNGLELVSTVGCQSQPKTKWTLKIEYIHTIITIRYAAPHTVNSFLSKVPLHKQVSICPFKNMNHNKQMNYKFYKHVDHNGQDHIQNVQNHLLSQSEFHVERNLF